MKTAKLDPPQAHKNTGRAFDSLAFSKRLQTKGFSQQQAEALAEEQLALIDDRLATKEDIESLRLSTKADIDALRLSTESKIETTAAQTRAEILKWVLGSIALQTLAILGAILAIVRSGH